MSGAIPLLSQYTFIAWTETNIRLSRSTKWLLFFVFPDEELCIPHVPMHAKCLIISSLVLMTVTT